MTVGELIRLTAHLPRSTVLVGRVARGKYDALPRPRETRVKTVGDVWVEDKRGAPVLAFDLLGRG